MAIDTDTKEIMESSYQSLLLAYAAGMLDQAQHLIVASHIALQPKAKKFVHTCEAVGGTLIEKHCEPVPMKDCSLGKVMDKIMNPCGEKKLQERCAGGARDDCHFPDKLDLPAPLARTVQAQPKNIQWRAVMNGIKAIELELACKQSHSRFVKLAPGAITPQHRHGGIEIILVLNGAFSDDVGQYRRGDLVVADERIEHAQKACKNDGCVCLMVSATPIRLTGIAALLNPFLRI